MHEEMVEFRWKLIKSNSKSTGVNCVINKLIKGGRNDNMGYDKQKAAEQM